MGDDDAVIGIAAVVREALADPDVRVQITELPRRNLDSGLAGGRLRRSGTVRISSYLRTL